MDARKQIEAHLMLANNHEKRALKAKSFIEEIEAYIGASEEYEKAAELGDASANYLLVELYLKMSNLAKDDIETSNEYKNMAYKHKNMAYERFNSMIISEPFQVKSILEFMKLELEHYRNQKDFKKGKIISNFNQMLSLVKKLLNSSDDVIKSELEGHKKYLAELLLVVLNNVGSEIDHHRRELLGETIVALDSKLTQSVNTILFENALERIDKNEISELLKKDISLANIGLILPGNASRHENLIAPFEYVLEMKGNIQDKLEISMLLLKHSNETSLSRSASKVLDHARANNHLDLASAVKRSISLMAKDSEKRDVRLQLDAKQMQTIGWDTIHTDTKDGRELLKKPKPMKDIQRSIVGIIAQYGNNKYSSKTFSFNKSSTLAAYINIKRYKNYAELSSELSNIMKNGFEGTKLPTDLISNIEADINPLLKEAMEYEKSASIKNVKRKQT